MAGNPKFERVKRRYRQYCKTGGIIIGQNWESYHNDMRIYRHIQSFKTRQKSGFIDPSIDLFLKILRGVYFVKDKKHFYLKKDIPKLSIDFIDFERR